MKDPNTVINWRKTTTGRETHLDDVLHVPVVFSDVTRGIQAKRDDLSKCFGAAFSQLDVCRLILLKGDVELGEEEREHAISARSKEIATLVAARGVDSRTGARFEVHEIEAAMRDVLKYAVNPGKPAKPQAYEVMSLLGKHLPIIRESEWVDKSPKVEQVEADIRPQRPPVTSPVLQSTSGLVCRSCVGVEFDSPQAQRAHYKTEFHLFNVKLKASGESTLPLEGFEMLSEEDKKRVLFEWKT